jgi:hypothetical protein
MQNQYFRLNPVTVGIPWRAEQSMETDDAGKIFPGSRNIKNTKPTEAESDGGDFFGIDLRLIPQRRQRRQQTPL